MLGFLSSFFLTPKIIKFCRAFNLTDQPSERKIHQKPTARAGGIAIFISFWLIISIMYLADPGSLRFVPSKIVGIDKNLLGVFIGALILFLSGLWDDIKGLKPGVKILFQTAGGVALVLFGVKINWFANPLGGLNIEIGAWTYIFVPLWVVLIVNVVNWLDGVDGLATGVGFIASLVLAFLSLAPYVNQASTAILALVLAGTLFGFLIFNFNPAKIFMGDSGSQFLGFMLATFAIVSGGKLFTAALVLGLPILDALWVIVRRIANKKTPWVADRLHLHHRFLDAGFSQRQTVIIMYAISAIFGMIALTTRTEGKVQAALCLLILTIALGAWLVVKKIKITKQIQNNAR